MKRSAAAIALLCIASTLLPATAALAQDSAALKREIARLQAELAQQKASCHAGPPAGAASGQRVGDLSFSVPSVRVGQATGSVKGTISVTTTISIRNDGKAPIALNYNSRSFGVVDDKGYEYRIPNEYLHGGNARFIKGLSIATSTKADTRDVLSPGQEVLVTFIAQRFMRDGEAPGNGFNINTSFGEYADEGEGRVRHVRDYPVGFLGVAAR